MYFSKLRYRNSIQITLIVVPALRIDMRRTTNPIQYARSPTKKFVAAVALSALFFAALVAVAYPVITAAGLAGAGTALVYSRVAGWLARRRASRSRGETVAETCPPLKEPEGQ